MAHNLLLYKSFCINYVYMSSGTPSRDDSLTYLRYGRYGSFLVTPVMPDDALQHGSKSGVGPAAELFELRAGAFAFR